MKNRNATWVLVLIVSLLMAACNTLQPSVRDSLDEAAVTPQAVREIFPIVPLPAVDTAMRDETPALWFVEFAGPPRVKGGSQAALRNARSAFAREAAAEGIRYDQRLDFGTLFNGMSVVAKPSQAAKLAKVSGVVAIYPVVEVDAPEPEFGTAPDMATALGMTGADVAQNEMGLTGKGIKVAIIDSGMDRGHPDFGDRIVAGWDFVGDRFGETWVPAPSEDYDDCNGHGTHVAGIVGANGGVVGVAPEVSFGAYKVFGCTGGSTADIILAAMERAYADNMQIINMSLGFAFMGWPQYPTAVASDNLVDRGVVVVASIGNSGASGVYSAGAPGIGRKVIGVASFDNIASSTAAFRLHDGEPSSTDPLVGYRPIPDAPVPPQTGTTPEIVYVGQGCNADAYLADPSGKVALATRGVCTFDEKYQRAVTAGAVGVIIENNAPGGFAGGGIVGVEGRFAVSISQEDGARIKQKATPSLSWTSATLTTPNPTGRLLSSFTSYGLTAELDLKPDLGAPGGLIRSTYPRRAGDRTGYATLSGTSMSAPHVAGAVALLLEARPNTRAETVRDLFQNSAEPEIWSLNPAFAAPRGLLDSVHRQGAGMINIPNTINSSVTVTPAKLSLGASDSGPFSTTLTLRNTSENPVTYNVSNNGNTVATYGNPYTPSYDFSFANASFSNTTVTVPGRGSITVSVTITADPDLVDGSVYGGYLVFTPQGVGQTVRVPYAGFKGDYQSIRILEPTANNFPLLTRLVGNSYQPVGAGAVFTMQDGDVPYVRAHFRHFVRRFEMTILDANGRRVHPQFSTAYELEYLWRSGTPNGFLVFGWDGERLQNRGRGNDNTKVVPNGRYMLEIKVLKALGNPSNPAHWESWTSPVFTVERPAAPRPGRGNAGR